MINFNQIIKHTLLSLLTLLILLSCSQKKAEPKIEKDYSQLEKHVNNTKYGYDKDSIQVIKDTIKPNQNLAEILSPYNTPYEVIQKIALASKSVYDVRKLATDKTYEIICSKDTIPKAKCFIYHPNSIDYIVYKFDD